MNTSIHSIHSQKITWADFTKPALSPLRFATEEKTANLFFRIVIGILACTLLLPITILGLIVDNCILDTPTIKIQELFNTKTILPTIGTDEESLLEKTLQKTPSFGGYTIAKGTSLQAPLTAFTVRPANLFYDALLGQGSTSLPGSPELFEITTPHKEVRQQILTTPQETIISFCAKGKQGGVALRNNIQPIADLARVYGSNSCQFSYGELKSSLESQKIYLSPELPLQFYKSLKKALLEDNITILPQSTHVKNLETKACSSLFKAVEKAPEKFGFKSKAHCSQILNLTPYQIGSMVVKSEDFHIFMDSNGKILNRKPGTKDAIRLINACGIRDFHTTDRATNKTIMSSTFKTALIATEKDYVIFPAVGMGVWGGDPEIYWTALLDAIVSSPSKIEKIFVSPGHQETRQGTYTGCKGEEFQTLLDSYRKKHAEDPTALNNLNKIINLFDRKTDVIHLAHRLKTAFPNKTISLLNASDPDVTLGYHVGEYVNSLRDNCPTTEENYTAMGTNGLLFETITGVHEDPARIIQVGN